MIQDTEYVSFNMFPIFLGNGVWNEKKGINNLI